MTSHNHEDKTLARALPDIESGFYIDVGANDPLTTSNSHPFYVRGWTGIDIEPIPHLARKLREVHPRNTVMQCAAGSRTGSATMALYAQHEYSTLSPETMAYHHELSSMKIEVSVLPLNTIIELHAPDREIDFISIDVEGYEFQVLTGLRLGINRPRILCIEATFPDSHIPAWEPWESLVMSKGYVFGHFDGCNRFYVRDEDATLRIPLLQP